MTAAEVDAKFQRELADWRRRIRLNIPPPPPLPPVQMDCQCDQNPASPEESTPLLAN